ncbi:MAG: LysR family transcriptional regulator [Alphaproteobacteria bacterium]|nr:LysR family transcriptional regulator [Alphaproteobacteria bacterium]
MADHQSVSKATLKLGLTQGTISTSLSKLENEVGEKLFIRHQNGLTLTFQGKQFYNIAKEVAHKVDELKGFLQTDKKMSGHLRVSAQYGVASFLLVDAAALLRHQFSNIFVEIVCENTDRKFEDYSCDVAIRSAVKKRMDLVQTYLFSTQFNMYASQKYLDSHGIPQTLGDLDRHHLISASYLHAEDLFFADWHLIENRQSAAIRKPVFSIDTSSGALKACEKGMGIATLPDFMLREIDEKLIRLLPDYQPPKLDFFLIYPKASQTSRKIQIFENFLVAYFKKKMS